MLNTVYDVLLFEGSDGSVDDGLEAALQDACHHLGSQAPELLLHLAEAKLYWIPIWAVSHAIDRAEFQILHRLLALFRAVRGQIVHEDADLVIAVLGPQPSKVLLELRDVHGFRELHVQLLALLARDARQHSRGGRVDPALVYRYVLMGQAVLLLRDRRPRDHCFIDIDDSVAITLGPLQLPDHLGFVADVVILVLLPSALFPFNAAPLDLVHPVHPTQESVVH